ncbi:MAG TPA: hypothetical protein VK611_13985 [Acidimicrobiales bacterium]|nr:hypothetical protein [Acidimicrobiales bacterium]
MRSADTSPEIYARQIEVYRSMSPERRLVIALELSEDVWTLAEHGIRTRHPNYDESQVRWALRKLRLGEATFRKVWPDAPLLAP